MNRRLIAALGTLLTLAAPALAAGAPASQPDAQAGAAAASPKCDVASAGIEETIAAKPALREGANAQTLRDLRTLRDAAIVLDTYHHAAECERLVAIVKAMAGHPARTIESSGDTDEDEGERLVEARKPKLVERGAAEKGAARDAVKE